MKHPTRGNKKEQGKRTQVQAFYETQSASQRGSRTIMFQASPFPPSQEAYKKERDGKLERVKNLIKPLLAK
jgi:hypothetical protein